MARLSDDPAASIRLAGVTKRFGDVSVLRGVDLDVAPGEVLALIGPSGGGKSTLLRLVNGLEVRDTGVLHVLGQDVPLPADGGGVRDAFWKPLRTRIGFVFQAFHLYPHKTARGNVALAPVEVLGRKADEAEARAEALLTQVGLGDKLDARPATLSGGQQQRVAIARALAMDPDILLFDEPTSALDPAMTAEVLAVMRDLVQDQARTVVAVTHEYAFAREAADRVAFLQDGRILEIGPAAQVLADPQVQATRAFLAQVL